MLWAQGAEKTILSKMLVEGSNKRTYAVDRHAGVVRAAAALGLTWRLLGSPPASWHSNHDNEQPAKPSADREQDLQSPAARNPGLVHLQAVSGIAADGRQVVNRGIAEAQNYKRRERNPIPRPPGASDRGWMTA